jgi:hypothetical protein
VVVASVVDDVPAVVLAVIDVVPSVPDESSPEQAAAASVRKHVVTIPS